MPMRSAILAAAMMLAALAPGAAQEGEEATDDGKPWAEFAARDRGFKISFPGSPETSNGAVAGLNPLTRYDFQVDDGASVYTLVVLEYPDGKGPIKKDMELFNRMLFAYAKESKLRIRRRERKTIADVEGLEAIADDGRRKVDQLVNMLRAGDRIYMLISAGPKGHAASDEAARFRDSFVLTDKPAEVEEGTASESNSSGAVPAKADQ